MASKTSTPTKSTRRTVTTTTLTQRSSSGDETPGTSASSPGRRMRSPSPARITRQQEKDALTDLNNRLAVYIDRVRYLETENNRLSVQVRSTEETVTREVSSIKSLYEAELEDARKLLDETAKEKARLQIEVGKYKTEADDWKVKYGKRDRECKDLEVQNAALIKENADLENRATVAESTRKNLEKENNKLRADLAALERQLASVKKQLEDETLLRVDLQNRLMSMKEDLTFKTQVYEQELNETKTRVTKEYEEVDSRIQDDYDRKLQEALQSMREAQDEQIREVRMEVELLYEKKLDDVQSALDRSMNASSLSSQDMILIRKQNDELLVEVNRLKNQIAIAEGRIADLEAQLAREREDFIDRLAFKDQEISDLRLTLAEQTQEYADLLEVKIKLDNEIAAYRHLLEGEEERLNLSQSESESTPRSVVRGAKRKRVALSDTVQEFSEASSSSSGFDSTSYAKGSVEIKDTDGEGRFIKLFNASEEDIHIGGWQLKHTAGDGPTNTYKFHRSLILRSKASCSVWSSGVGQTHSPPSDLVMKGAKWNTNDTMKTVLVDGDGEEVASRSLTKCVQRTASSYRSSRGLDTVDARSDGDNKCVVM